MRHIRSAFLARSPMPRRKNLNLDFTAMRLSILEDSNERYNGRLQPLSRDPLENNQSHTRNGPRLAQNCGDYIKYIIDLNLTKNAFVKK